MIPNKDIFCSSPWVHLRIGYMGIFIPCRWADKNFYVGTEFNIRTHSMVEYFNSPPMTELRNQLLSGTKPTACHPCYYEDEHNNLSGRKKQLYRSNLHDEFNFVDSPHYSMFEFSQTHQGTTNSLPYDLQIDLTNTCNSACIMCHPKISSQLYTDYVKLNNSFPLVFEKPEKIKCWADDPALVDKFITELKELPNIEYIHFIGGETLYIESFYTICEALIDAGLSKNIILGTTTNGTVYSARLERIMSKFKACHLGLSIEANNSVNNYIRYPSDLSRVKSIFSQFIELRKNVNSLVLSLRITPNLFSIFYFDLLVQYMLDNNIAAESCNILRNPSVLKIELLPDDLKEQLIQKLLAVATKNNLVREKIDPNTRDTNVIKQVISNVLFGYIDFLLAMKKPDNVEDERYKLVQFLKGFESLRRNSIIDCAPEFTSFLKTYGY